MAKNFDNNRAMVEMCYCGGNEGEKAFVIIGIGATYETGDLFLKAH
jgi:hypothetical protein